MQIDNITVLNAVEANTAETEFSTGKAKSVTLTCVAADSPTATVTVYGRHTSSGSSIQLGTQAYTGTAGNHELYFRYGGGYQYITAAVTGYSAGTITVTMALGSE